MCSSPRPNFLGGLVTTKNSLLGVDSPFFSTIVLFNNQLFFRGFCGFLQRSIVWKERGSYPQKFDTDFPIGPAFAPGSTCWLGACLPGPDVSTPGCHKMGHGDSRWSSFGCPLSQSQEGYPQKHSHRHTNTHSHPVVYVCIHHAHQLRVLKIRIMTTHAVLCVSELAVAVCRSKFNPVSRALTCA